MRFCSDLHVSWGPLDEFRCHFHFIKVMTLAPFLKPPQHAFAIAISRVGNSLGCVICSLVMVTFSSSLQHHPLFSSASRTGESHPSSAHYPSRIQELR
jgi:hypothetical protein